MALIASAQAAIDLCPPQINLNSEVLLPKIFLICLFLMFHQSIFCQSAVSISNRQEVILNGRLVEKNSISQSYSIVEDLPEIKPVFSTLGKIELAWDGTRAYQVGLREDKKRIVSIGTPLLTPSSAKYWFWAEPKVLPLAGGDAYTLLGAWNECLLFLATTRGGSGSIAKGSSINMTSAQSQSLLYIDLWTNKLIKLTDIPNTLDLRSSSIFSQDAFWVFFASGKAFRIRVNTEPWSIDQLGENFWIDSGISLCKDTGEFSNPVIFGRPFFDREGSILLPAQVFLPLSRDDIDRAWSKIPQIQRTELILKGEWPIPEGREIGWKDGVVFLLIDPLTAQFSQVKREYFSDLTVEEDKNFIIQRFRDPNPRTLYTFNGERILTLDEILKSPRQNTNKIKKIRK